MKREHNNTHHSVAEKPTQSPSAAQSRSMKSIRGWWVAATLASAMISGTLAAIPAKTAEPTEPSSAVDINRASVAELMLVPGMTASWAGRIVRFRPYRTKLDLLQEGVVTPEVYQRIRDGLVAHRASSKSGQKPPLTP